MNLTHLFNANYFVQNIKKSRAMILLSSLILPVFTLLLLNALSQDRSHAIEFWQLGLFNIIFMYLIPVVLSIKLFDFVFKKRSCDFIGSMPISRKTIFTTNTLGGIAIIILIQAITAILSFAFAKIFASTIIFGSMIWDVFVFFTIAYIFVFVACNLAISFSGNMFATIVSLLLILFFVPFLVSCSRIKENVYSYSYNFSISEDKTMVTYYEDYNMTAPSHLFMIAVSGNETYVFNSIVALKTFVFSICYFFVGLFLFNRKKFEMAEESYENDFIHLGIKCLTLAPFIAILVIGEGYESGIGMTFLFAVLIVYYFLFDMITNKKIKIPVSIISFVVFCLMMTGVFVFIVPHLNKIYKKTFDVSEVKSITIDSFNVSTYYNDLGLVIDDEELAQQLLVDDTDYHLYSPYSYINSDKEVNMTVTLKNSKKIPVSKWIGDSFKIALEKYGNEKYVSNDSFVIPLLDGSTLTKKEQALIREKVKEDLKDVTYKEYYDMHSDGREAYYLTLSYYKNHKLNVKDISYERYKETNKEVIKILNANAVKNCQKAWTWNLSVRDAFIDYIAKANFDVNFQNDDDSYGFEYKPEMAIREEDFKDGYDYDKTIYGVLEQGFSNISLKEMQSFIKAHKDEDFSKQKPYVVLYGYSTVIFYTNDVEGLYKIFAKAYNDSGAYEYSGIKLNENV